MVFIFQNETMQSSPELSRAPSLRYDLISQSRNNYLPYLLVVSFQAIWCEMFKYILKTASAIKHIFRKVNVRFLYVHSAAFNVIDFKFYQFFNQPVSPTLVVSISFVRIVPACTVSVAREINVCFSYRHSTVINVSNF